MELRRALLLFAIVLGVAAIVAALANPSSQQSDRTENTTASEPPTRDAGRGRPPARIRISARRAPTRHAVELGRATTIVVAVDEPGQVAIKGLGLVDSAEPHDPAVFETLPTKRTRYRVLFTPAGGVRARPLGELSVVRRNS